MNQFCRVDDGQSPGLSALADAPAAIFDAIPSAICVIDIDGRIIRYNHRAKVLWGEAPQPGKCLEALCESCRIYGNGRELSFAETPAARVLQTGVPVAEQELEFELPDGRSVALLVNCEPVRDDEGQLAGAICCFRDITETVRTRSALRRSLQDLEDFFENGAVGLHLVAADGTILRANQAELDLLGYTREEYVGRSIRDFHADEDAIADILARLSRGRGWTSIRPASSPRMARSAMC
ncbi:PAS domain-containing protein [Pedomonas mirosovicensis]|uniref:PAS domain-containing protein n=1 Tax=Pedomonas mirosovicensis TaxID=2908641 RepID=UPI002167E273|nr:PAS domain-containing protein [Pedomonas mirosovicensis]MCH8685186.1 PAS domain-containing protein [Pedomonas mirosovicensis]